MLCVASNVWERDLGLRDGVQLKLRVLTAVGSDLLRESVTIAERETVLVRGAADTAHAKHNTVASRRRGSGVKALLSERDLPIIKPKKIEKKKD